MFDESKNYYFVDHHFLENAKIVDKSNWYDYIQFHPEYEANCLNQMYIDQPDLNVNFLLKKNEKGIYFEFEENPDKNVATIRKLLLDEGKIYLLKVFYLYENKIFEALDLRETALQKVGNISSLMNQIIVHSMNN